jgi:HEAT repeat protein
LDESEPQVLRDLGDLLYGMASTAVQFSDYELASRILLELRTRRAQLHESGGREGGSLASLLARRFDPAALKLLDHDLRSGQPDRHQQAAEVLGALGPVATPLLIDVIKQESDFRIRQLAARLLAETDPDAGDHIKRALVTEVIVEHRAHVLEVIDIVTRDLQLELDQCLHDPSARVRRAAFQLFERLGQDSLIPLVAGLANDLDPAVVRGAIRALSLVRSPLAVRALAQTLQTTRDPSVAALCCRALGQSDQATAIDALERVLRERRMPFFGRRWGAEVRAVAGLALRQISHAHATEVLRRYQNDRHPQVRAVARGLTGVVPAGNGKRPSGATPELTGELPPEL